MNTENKIKLFIFFLVFGTMTLLVIFDKELKYFAPAAVNLSSPILQGGINE